jgi:hypothetical protein
MLLLNSTLAEIIIPDPHKLFDYFEIFNKIIFFFYSNFNFKKIAFYNIRRAIFNQKYMITYKKKIYSLPVLIKNIKI